MLHDISPPLSPRSGVWPGDTPLSREVLLDLEEGSHLTLSTLRATVHLGAHADAPSHFRRGAPAIDAVPLEAYVGPCELQVLRVAPGTVLQSGDLRRPPRRERLLLATGVPSLAEGFVDNFVACSVELIEFLRDKGVRLIGLDSSSVDPFDSKDLPAHGACFDAGMAILEGLDLSGVQEGDYELIALPLRLVGFDASPVRAVLRSLGGR